MSGDLSCVYCPSDTMFRPDKIYILDGCSVCEPCMREIQASYEESGEGYRPLSQNVSLNEILEPKSSDSVEDAVARRLTGLIMKLYDENGVCLMSSKVESPVVNGDTIQFPPIQVSL